MVTIPMIFTIHDGDHPYDIHNAGWWAVDTDCGEQADPPVTERWYISYILTDTIPGTSRFSGSQAACLQLLRGYNGMDDSACQYLSWQIYPSWLEIFPFTIDPAFSPADGG